MKNMRLSTVLGDETDIKKAQMLNSCYSAKIIRHVIGFSLNFDNRKYPLSIFEVLSPNIRLITTFTGQLKQLIFSLQIFSYA
jgi:hypothetical protein